MTSNYTQLQEYKVSLLLTPKGKKTEIFLDVADITDCVIIWDYSIFLVEGYILYKDSAKYLEFIPPTNDIKIKIYGKDKVGITFERIFTVTSINKDLSDSKFVGSKIEFMDEYSNMINNTYISKGYNNKNATEIINDILQTSPLITTPLKVISPNKDLPKYENYVIMGNKSLAANINNLENQDNAILINQRKHISFIKTDKLGELTPDVSNGIVFSNDPQYENTPFFASNVQINYSNNLNNNIVLQDSVSYQVDTKKIIIKQHTTKESHKNLNLDTKVALSGGFNGKKIFAYSNNIMDRLYNLYSLMDASITVETAGNFSVNLLQKVSYKSNSTVEKVKGKMPYITGQYYVTKIIDRIQGGNFNQLITLGRIGAK